MGTQLHKIFSLGSIAFLGLLLVQPASADSLALRNGHQVQGKFLGGTRGVIAFSVSGATQYYNVSDVLGMTFEEETSQSSDDTQQPSVVPQNGPVVTLPQSQKIRTTPGNKITKHSQLRTI